MENGHDIAANRIPLQAWGETNSMLRKEPISYPLLLVYTMWVLFLFEPEWWLASFGAAPLKRLPILLLPLAVGVTLFKADLRSLHWPMALFLILHMISLPFVINRGYAMEPFKLVLLVNVLLVASATTIDSARKALPILKMYFIHFAWWVIHGLPNGGVGWHSTLSNPDGFGPLMVIGIAFTSSFALGTRVKGTRYTAILVTTLCAVGLVAASARGAVLAMGPVFAVWWLRSHRKLATFVGVLLIIGVVAIASHILFPNGAFWEEMKSSMQGFDDPTGADRKDLWLVGWEVFLQSPLVGVGARNFGAYAAENFLFGEASGFYENPAHLYGRSMHNIFFQLLAEQGIIGSAIFLFIIIDFVRRNKSLRTAGAIEHWEKAVGRRFDLRAISLGLEGAMVGFLASGFFYDQLYVNFFYSIVALNLILYSVSAPRGTAPRQRGRQSIRQESRIAAQTLTLPQGMGCSTHGTR